MAVEPNDDTAFRALAELGRLEFHELSIDSFLQRVVELTNVAMPRRGEVSISIAAGGRPSTAASTGQLALDCDESQYVNGAGPCLESAATGEVIEIPDVRVETRWPAYAERAAEVGALSSLSLPLLVNEQVKGSLNIYSRDSHAFDDEARAAAQKFAPYAGVAVSNMLAYQDARRLAANLQAALDSRAVIDQAKGILMERHKLTADVAFQVLVRRSMQTNRKVRELAEELVTTGFLPGSHDLM